MNRLIPMDYLWNKQRRKHMEVVNIMNLLIQREIEAHFQEMLNAI